MADSSSNSNSSTSGAVGEIRWKMKLSFVGIQPWRFEPPGRVVATQERGDDIVPPRRCCDQDSEDW